MHSCLLSCSVLFLLLAVPGLNFSLWDLVPWSRIKLRTPAVGVQSPIPWTKVPPKIKVLSQVIMLAGTLAQWITEVLLNFCACSGIPRLQHSFWKLTELSTTWKPKPDMIPISNCFQLTEEQVKKKRNSSVLSVVPLAWTQRCGMRDQTGSRGLKQLYPGEQNLLGYFPFTLSLFRFSFVFSSPSPFLCPVCRSPIAQVSNTQCAGL